MRHVYLLAFALAALAVGARPGYSQRVAESQAGFHRRTMMSIESPLRRASASVADSNTLSPAPFIISGILAGAMLGAAIHRMRTQDEPDDLYPLFGVIYLGGGGLLGGLVGLLVWEGARKQPAARGVTGR
jgi:hypothetical protein